MRVATTGENEPFNRASVPSELAPYWPSRIEHDRLWYRKLAVEGERFYCPHEDHVYRLTDIQNDGDVFSLHPCAKTEDLTDGFEEPLSEPNFVDNVCALAGAIEAGDLIHLESGVIKTVGDAAFLTVGELTVELPETEADSNALLNRLDPPNGPASTDIAKLAPTLRSLQTTPLVYVPTATPRTESATPTTQTQSSARVGEDVDTQFFSVQPFSRWTFEDATIRAWVESHFESGDRILNACAGATKLTPPPGGDIVRNDTNPDRDADYHRDVAELAAIPDFQADDFDVIIFDPPWSLYQANLRYSGEYVTKEGIPEIDLSTLPFETPDPEEKTQLGHSRLAKEGFNHLLRSGGIVIELTFHGTAMPNRLGYEQVRRAMFNPLGEAKAVIGSVDRKVRQELTDFF
ncbi:hypothetical protein [Haloarcula sp. K1]|jgi:hypothetical protein|uniref:hypothetical protein n=1 Tax=Haloarcula sp. K1 TaxID=1622207 RepID=UPI0007BAF401|nr:hypothetical protein [Haloarcula sp. K1]KZX46262.1 hypothetical protein AV929_15945 [Haloarcula sp. K1]